MSGYRNIWWTVNEDIHDKIYVIPGTHTEGAMYAKEQCQLRWNSGDTSACLSDYVVVEYGRVDKLRGVRNPHGMFVGTWREREDLHDICIQLNLSHDHQNAAIQKIMKDYLGY
jgi:hypothetical protein